MTGAVIGPVVPVPLSGGRGPQAGRGSVGVARGLPLPDLRAPALRSSALVYGVAAVDCRGRIADQVVLRALGWAPGTRLGVRLAGALVVIEGASGAAVRVSRLGHVRLPAAIRRGCGLVAGDRVLLAADAMVGRLVVYPPAALDAALAASQAGLRDGDPR